MQEDGWDVAWCRSFAGVLRINPPSYCCQLQWDTVCVCRPHNHHLSMISTLETLHWDWPMRSQYFDTWPAVSQSEEREMRPQPGNYYQMSDVILYLITNGHMTHPPPFSISISKLIWIASQMKSDLNWQHLLYLETLRISDKRKHQTWRWHGLAVFRLNKYIKLMYVPSVN